MWWKNGGRRNKGGMEKYGLGLGSLQALKIFHGGPFPGPTFGRSLISGDQVKAFSVALELPFFNFLAGFLSPLFHWQLKAELSTRHLEHCYSDTYAPVMFL